jgi:flagellar biosynthetic protein FliP
MRKVLFLLALLMAGFSVSAHAVTVPAFDFVREARTPGEVNLSLQLVFLFTIMALGPSILIMMTSFTRIAVVLSFLKQAMGTRDIPPSQLVVGLALFLTAFIMMPVWRDINTHALQPYTAGLITQDKAIELGMKPIREFMLRQTREKEIALFVHIADQPRPDKPEDVSTSVLIPAFIISELKTAFIIGFVLYIPFLIIDMIVASILMSMGMMMLPPVMVSMPFKLILFVLVDGWYLVIKSLVESFR